MSDSETPESATLSDAASIFVEDFSESWGQMGAPRVEARVLALLLITEEPLLSSAQLGELLQASAGAVSVAVRTLTAQGFIKRRVIPGDRNHYFHAEEDVWASFLQKERDYLPQMRRALLLGLEALPPTAEAARKRLTIAIDYHSWIAQRQLDLAREWAEHRANTSSLSATGEKGDQIS